LNKINEEDSDKFLENEKQFSEQLKRKKEESKTRRRKQHFHHRKENPMILFSH
jgi:hypothetical protein